MALPTIEKSWQLQVNQLVNTGNQTNNNKTCWLDWKNALKGFATNPWTVKYSCNATTAGTSGDGIDRWTSITDLTFNTTGNAHSWMVLDNVNGCEFLIECNGDGAGVASNITLYISGSAGFTGGTTTTRPTATDEVTVSAANNSLFFPTSGAVQVRWTAMMSTDAEVTRIFGFIGGNASQYIEIGKAKSPVSGWTTPWYLCAIGGSGGQVMSNANLNTGSTAVGWRHGAFTAAGIMLTESYAGTGPLGASLSGVDSYNSAYILSPISLVSNTIGARGVPGKIYDIWYGPSGVNNGDTYSIGTVLIKDFVHVGPIVVPAGGVSWLTS